MVSKRQIGQRAICVEENLACGQFCKDILSTEHIGPEEIMDN
ncbi:16578_t:CDS:2 [Funneliformis mosseae]|uniref:16578_t:CDS:1 n=1 Tax=Funneliformis mosseae TaxID=27381 RepID=A0A9N9GA61_FUNMO|nr:16578_t:CDS:2 [Funneliformis mosseae]